MILFNRLKFFLGVVNTYKLDKTFKLSELVSSAEIFFCKITVVNFIINFLFYFYNQILSKAIIENLNMIKNNHLLILNSAVNVIIKFH